VSAAADAASAVGLGARRTVPVALSIARVEAGRMLRHPVAIAGALLGTGLLVVATWRDAPVLNRHDALVSEAQIPLAIAFLVVAHLATIRPARHHTTELHEAAPSTQRVVTAGLLLAVALAGVAALALVGVHLAFLEAVGGVGTPRLAALVTGPAIVVLAGAIGVALGRWAPWIAAGPLAIVALAAVTVGLLTRGDPEQDSAMFYVSPVMPSETWAYAVTELSHKPLGWHLAYVVALAAAAAGVALWRHPRRAVAVGLVACALAVAVVSVRQQARPVTRRDELARAALFLDADRSRVCERSAGVRYCAYRQYAPWIELWRAPVEGVLDRLPAAARPEGLAVEQLPGLDEVYASGAWRLGRRYERWRRRGGVGSPNALHPTLHWGRNDAEGDFALGLALQVAQRAAGMDTSFVVREADLRGLSRGARRELEVGRRAWGCTTLDQGRTIVVLWLAARATPSAEAAFRDVVAEMPLAPDRASRYFAAENYVLSEHEARARGDWSITTAWGNREAHYAARLLERDDAGRAVRRSWERLTDPRTTTDEAASLLGLEPLPPLDRLARAAGQKPRALFWSPRCR
jgi:hypothetical protein